MLQCAKPQDIVTTCHTAQQCRRVCRAGSQWGCVQIPNDCGTKEGSPCCPVYGDQVAFNPPRFSTPQCLGDLFCHDYWNATSATANICFANKPDCGQFGKACCRNGSTGDIFDGVCGLAAVQPGPKGWCDVTSASGLSEEPYGLCRPCPPKERLGGFTSSQEDRENYPMNLQCQRKYQLP